MLLLSLLAVPVAARNFLVDRGVDMIASNMASYRNADVPSSVAVSKASTLIGSYVDAPPVSSYIAKMIRSVEGQFIGAGPGALTVDQDQVLGVVNDFKTVATQFHEGSEFPQFQKAVKSDLSSFNVKSMVADASRRMKAGATATNSNVQQIKDTMATITSGPKGKQIMSGAQELYDDTNNWLDLHLPAFNFWLALA